LERERLGRQRLTGGSWRFPAIAWVAAASACACATVGPSAPAPAQCLRLVALDPAGGSVVEERGLKHQFHVQRPGRGGVTTVTQEQCEGRGDCALFGQRPAAEFWLLDAKVPVEKRLPLPGLGEQTLSLGLGADRFGGQVWRLSLVRPGKAPQVAWVYPAELGAEGSRWFRAKDALWVELSGRTEGLACVALEADLALLSSQALDADAVTLLGEGELAQAEPVLRRAVEVAPFNATARYNLACTLSRAGRADEAMGELAEALALEPLRLAMFARVDPDLDPLRDRDDFKRLVDPAGAAARP